jgi:hypothetical protein
MSADDWKTLILALTFLSGVVHWVVTFWFRRDDQTWVETMKGEIRRDVEENLKTHESRLRMQADLKLRQDERSWGLLKDFVAAAWKLHDRLWAFSIAAVQPMNAGKVPSAQQHEQANEALITLVSLCATLPPESGKTSELVAEFQAALKACTKLAMTMESELGGTARGNAGIAAKEMADRAVLKANNLAKQWNAALWKDSSQLIGQPVVTPAASAAAPAAPAAPQTPLPPPG